MDGGKIKNLINSGNFETRCYCAALQFNKGPLWPIEIWNNFFKSTNPYLEEYLKQKNEISIKAKSNKTCEYYIQTRIYKKYFKNELSNDIAYGENPIDPMDLEKPNLLAQATKFLKRIILTECEMQQLSQNTIN